MTITRAQVDLVQQSAAAVDHVLEPFTAAFYDRLFREHPALRPMFPADPAEQAAKVAAELRRIVGALLEPERFTKQVRSLGARHHGYGAQPAHYAAMGVALLATFADQLGDAFTPELHDAWAAAFGTIAALMIEAQEAAALEMAS